VDPDETNPAPPRDPLTGESTASFRFVALGAPFGTGATDPTRESRDSEECTLEAS
jgi:hypothetical protein